MLLLMTLNMAEITLFKFIVNNAGNSLSFSADSLGSETLVCTLIPGSLSFSSVKPWPVPDDLHSCGIHFFFFFFDLSSADLLTRWDQKQASKSRLPKTSLENLLKHQVVTFFFLAAQSNRIPYWWHSGPNLWHTCLHNSMNLVYITIAPLPASFVDAFSFLSFPNCAFEWLKPVDIRYLVEGKGNRWKRKAKWIDIPLKYQQLMEWIYRLNNQTYKSN